MPYMAVGSRQILFSDSVAPHSSTDTQAQVANLSDNRNDRVVEEQARKREEVQAADQSREQQERTRTREPEPERTPPRREEEQRKVDLLA